MEKQIIESINLFTENKDNNQNDHHQTEQEKEEENKNENIKEEFQPAMILNIDIGNNQIEQLKIYNIDQPEKDAYEFCFQHQLDYSSLVEISKQIHSILNESQNGSPQIQLNENQLQDNIMTTAQTETKNENVGTNNQSSIARNYNNNNVIQNQNLLSYSENKENGSKTHINPQALINNEIVVTDNNDFYLTNKKKNTKKSKSICNRIQPKVQIRNTREQQDKTKELPFTNRFNNIGVQMYQKGLERIKKTNQKVESLRDALNKSDEEIYTFKPQVNIQTPSSKYYRDNNKKAYNNPHIILNYKLYNERKQIMIQEKNAMNSDKILFTPIINKHSATLDKDNNITNKSSSSRFEKLYEDKTAIDKKIKALAKIITKQYTYCPKINSTNKSCESSKVQNSLSAKEKRAKLINEKEHYYNYDKNTNQKLFQPKLIAKYKLTKEDNNNKEGKTNRYETMYNFAEYYRKRKHDLAAETNFIETVNTYCSSKTSNDLLNTKKHNSFKKIFKLLDSDEDEIIGSNSYNTNKLPKEIKEILNPIFIEFKEDYETLNENEFIKVCEQLFLYCSREQKKVLINFNDNLTKNNKNAMLNSFSFKPAINKNTTSILKRIDKVFDIDLQNISRIGTSINNDNK